MNVHDLTEIQEKQAHPRHRQRQLRDTGRGRELELRYLLAGIRDGSARQSRPDGRPLAKRMRRRQDLEPVVIVRSNKVDLAWTPDGPLDADVNQLTARAFLFSTLRVYVTVVLAKCDASTVKLLSAPGCRLGLAGSTIRFESGDDSFDEPRQSIPCLVGHFHDFVV